MYHIIFTVNIKLSVQTLELQIINCYTIFVCTIVFFVKDPTFQSYVSLSIYVWSWKTLTLLPKLPLSENATKKPHLYMTWAVCMFCHCYYLIINLCLHISDGLCLSRILQFFFQHPMLWFCLVCINARTSPGVNATTHRCLNPSLHFCLVQIPTLAVLATWEHMCTTGSKHARLSQILKTPKRSALNAPH